MSRRRTKTGGRAATEGVIPGRYALSVGDPGSPLPDGWHWTRLLDVARLETGHTPSRRKPEYWGGDIPWIGIKDARVHHGRDIYSTNEATNQLGIDNSAARVLPVDTVCLSRTASIGYITRTKRLMCTSQDFVNWVCDESGLTSRYLMYVLLAEVESLFRFAHGTSHQTIYFPEVKAFHAALPPIEEQRRIAAVLGALDDKIELTRRMNQTLEEMAQAVFKSWFVDFDGHDPSELVDSELGPIPKRWTPSAVGEHVSLQRGKTYKSKLKGLPGPWLLGLASIHRNGRFRADKLVRYGGDSPPQLLVDEGDLYVSLKDVTQTGDLLGAVARLPAGFGVGRVTQDTVRLIPAEGGLPMAFIYRLLLSEKCRAHFRARRTGTTTSALARGDFLGYGFAMPSDETIAAYVSVESGIIAKQENCDAQSRTLAELRDTLLPKLISGEIRVPEAEAAVEAAL